jgi:putative flavoprotein involved in K+ transport
MTAQHEVAIVGGGQAGLSLSWYLQREGVEHVVFEKERVLHVWRTQRWDSFCLVTPNWQCALPGYGYAGPDPHGFMVKDELNTWLAGFTRHVAAPLQEGVAVERVRVRDNGFALSTSAGECTAAQVVAASGGYHDPIVPRFAERFPPSITQLNSAQYRSPQALPPGAVLVIGCGQSGVQIAEDLHLAGRCVFLATGDAPRCARFYRGRDVVDWLAEMGYYDMPVQDHPLKEGVRDNTNHYVTGRDGGRDLDLRAFARDGMQLFGRLVGLDGARLLFEPNLSDNLEHADRIYNGINASIDKYIAARGLSTPPAQSYVPVWEPSEERTELDSHAAGITSAIWCIGFRPSFGWLDAPVFTGRGDPVHTRGVSQVRGLYFVGLPWLYTWGSGRFSGVARDARYIADRIVEHRRQRQSTLVAA